jgi:hypothetical protein
MGSQPHVCNVFNKGDEVMISQFCICKTKRPSFDLRLYLRYLFVVLLVNQHHMFSTVHVRFHCIFVIVIQV